MNCREFEHAWQSRLDHPGSPIIEESLEAHAQACALCRSKGDRYELLAKAIGLWEPRPEPAVDLADRVLAEVARGVEPEPAGRILRFPPAGVAWWSAAAATLLAGAFGLWAAFRAPDRPGEPPAVARQGEPGSAQPVGESLVQVTSATLDLAEKASAPAARLGLLVLNSATEEARPPEAGESEATGEVLRSVGDRVSSGVRPISGSARRAFGFLLGPAAERENDPSRPRRRGA